MLLVQDFTVYYNWAGCFPWDVFPVCSCMHVDVLVVFMVFVLDFDAVLLAGLFIYFFMVDVLP